MGQINLPLLNKAGHSVFWDSCFEDKLNYRRYLHVSLFSKKVVRLFFRDKISRTFTFLKKKKLNLFLKEFEPQLTKTRRELKMDNFIKSSLNFNLKNKFFRTIKNIPSYVTKLFFIKYNNWIIVTFRIYVPLSKVFKKKKIVNKYKVFKKVNSN